MEKNRRYRIILWFIFFFALALRLALIRFNRAANDDHLAVANLILKNLSLPIMTDCWECFQPKLFHLTFAFGLKVVGLIVALPPYRQNLVGEAINFIAAGILLVFVWKFIKRAPVQHDRLRLVAFALVALNPPLVGINAQATNDTFAILFSTLAIYYAFDYFQAEKTKAFLLAILFTVLGIASKSNVWVTAIAIFAIFLVKAWVRTERRGRTAALGIVFFVTVLGLSLANPLNQVIINMQKFGTPFVNAWQAFPLPDWSTPTYIFKPGIISIREGLFTFKFIALLDHPRIEIGAVIYPSFRTSLWSLLYGRAYSLHFLNWPPAWSTTGEELFPLTRSIFILALVPTLLLLCGAAIEFFRICRSVLKRDETIAGKSTYGLFIISAFGYLVFITIYGLLYRDIFTMNDIFIFPALLSFTFLFLRAGDMLYAVSSKIRWLSLGFEIAIGVLVVLFSIDIITLTFQLALPYLHTSSDSYPMWISFLGLILRSRTPFPVG